MSSRSGRRVLERELGRTAARRGRAWPASSSPARRLRPPRRRRRIGEDEKMRRRLRAFDERQLCPRSASPRISTRPAAGSPSKAPSASATAALPWWRSSSSARAAFDCCVGKREIGRHGAEQRRRARGASQLLEHQHDFAQSGLARHRSRARRGPGRPCRATAPRWPGRCPTVPRPGRPASVWRENSRTDLRSRPRSASDIPSVVMGLGGTHGRSTSIGHDGGRTLYRAMCA